MGQLSSAFDDAVDGGGRRVNVQARVWLSVLGVPAKLGVRVGTCNLATQDLIPSTADRGRAVSGSSLKYPRSLVTSLLLSWQINLVPFSSQKVNDSREIPYLFGKNSKLSSLKALGMKQSRNQR